MPRKRLRLRDFDYTTPGAYFVTICTASRAPLLVVPVAREIQRQLTKLVERFPGLVVDESVIMADHLHVIFVLDGHTAPLPRILQALKSLTTLMVPRERWPLWQRGYYEHVIRNEDELEMIREYIHNNPLAEQVRIQEG